MEARILAIYQKGMSVRDIEDHIRDIYGVDTSASLISRITDNYQPLYFLLCHSLLFFFPAYIAYITADVVTEDYLNLLLIICYKNF